MVSSKEEKSKKELTPGERIELGQIHVRVIIEILGKPKEYVEKTLKTYLAQIKEDSAFDVEKAEIADAEEVEKGMFSTFAEVEMWAKNTIQLIGFCFDYMPSSIEIIDPETLHATAGEFSGMLNDLQAKLHQVDSEYKTTKKENETLRVNLSNTLRNIVMLGISIGKKTVNDLATITGIKEEHLNEIVTSLVEEKRLQKKGESYELAE